jgi:hypothetical protein
MSIDWVVLEVKYKDWRKCPPYYTWILCTKGLGTVSWNRVSNLDCVFCCSQQIVHIAVIPNRRSSLLSMIGWDASWKHASTWMWPVFELRFVRVAENVTWITDRPLPSRAPVRVTSPRKCCNPVDSDSVVWASLRETGWWCVRMTHSLHRKYFCTRHCVG